MFCLTHTENNIVPSCNAHTYTYKYYCRYILQIHKYIYILTLMYIYIMLLSRIAVMMYCKSGFDKWYLFLE